MATNYENMIIDYLLDHDQVTWLECEATGMDLHHFIETAARMKFKGTLDTNQVQRIKPKSQTKITVNEYTLTQQAKTINKK